MSVQFFFLFSKYFIKFHSWVSACTVHLFLFKWSVCLGILWNLCIYFTSSESLLHDVPYCGLSKLQGSPCPCRCTYHVPPFQSVARVCLWLVQAVITEFPATPSKFHYTFSFRDLSRIWAGILLTTPECVKTMAVFVRVWRNEFTRVVFDRLITEQVSYDIKYSVSWSCATFLYVAQLRTVTSDISFGENKFWKIYVRAKNPFFIAPNSKFVYLYTKCTGLLWHLSNAVICPLLPDPSNIVILALTESFPTVFFPNEIFGVLAVLN